MNDDQERDEILELEKQRCAALMAADLEALALIVSDDLVHIHGNGHVDAKAEYLTGVRSKYIFHKIERGALNVRVYGDFAVVVGPLKQTVEVRGIEGQNEMTALSSQTWIRSACGWRQNTCHMHFLAV